MTLFLENGLAQNMLAAVRTAIDAGTAAVIEIYADDGDGIPADASVAVTNQTKLATLVMGATAFGAISDANPGAIMTAAAVATVQAVATGTAAWFRLSTQVGGTVILQGTVGTSGADLLVSNMSFTAGADVILTAGTITQPES